MIKETVWLMDNKNKFPPLQEMSGMNNNELYIISLFIICYWIYLHYRKYFIYTKSCIIGCLSSLLILLIYYIKSQYTLGLYGTNNNKWIYTYTKWNDMITDLNHIKIDKSKYPGIDKENNGYLISKEYYEKLKNKIKITSMADYNKKKLSTALKNPSHKYMLNLLNNKNEMLIFQGFCLITILFTILSLIWHINKTLFKKLTMLFMHAVSISIPFILLSYWYSDIQEWLVVYNMKNICLFIGIAITIAILTEIITYYSENIK